MAQPIAGPGRPNPLDAGAPVLPAVHDSPFAQYRAFAAEEVGPWKAMNDEVGRIGGWKVYAREAHEATKPSPAAGEQPATPSAGPANSEATRAK